MKLLEDDTQQIGRIAAVESERVQIELDLAATGLVKAGTAGVIPVGSINSYVTIDVGPHRVVAVITALRMAQEPARGSGPYDVQEAVSRTLEATMVGRLERGAFIPGVATYPPLFAPVSAATRSELGAIFRPGDGPSVRLGEAVVSPDQDVMLDANRLLARHSAVLGTTGAGKSCSVTALLDGILRLDVPHANVVLFDANGEYAAAFAGETERGRTANACVIGPEPGPASGLVVPHWFMNSEEHIALLRAADAVQAPLLQRAIADARLGSETSVRAQLLVVKRSVDTLRGLDGGGGQKPQPAMARHFEGLQLLVEDYAAGASDAEWRTRCERIGGILADVPELGLERDEKRAWDAGQLNAHQRQAYFDLLSAIEREVAEAFNALGLGTASASSDFDAPAYYSLQELADVFLPHRITLEAEREPRIENYMATLLMRLSRLLADGRYDFLTRVDAHDAALSRFLRLLLGIDPLDADVGELPPWARAYSDQMSEPGRGHSVTIVDLSMIAFDVLDNVAALLARLLFDFVQRIEPRGCFPVLLVLEEAHRYVPASSSDQRSAVIFERIAKEGRKFGISLMLASQRPSELSPTVLAQCGTLVAHRIVSEADQAIVRHATPFAARDVIRQLPGLATQHAVVVGEAIAAPALVRVANVDDPPASRDPDFIAAWKSGPPGDAGDLIDDAASRWERGERTRSRSEQPSGGTSDSDED